jgi:succinate dehydrogenase hydrophobic anchor subunit
MRRILRENGLSIVLFLLFLFSLVGQILTGHSEYNDDQQEHGQPTVGVVEYLATGHFVEAIFENWESEFLQMSAYVVFTIFLYQKGSSESKEPGKLERTDIIPESARKDKDAPWPVRRGGLVLKLYENSLSLTLFLLFLASFALHAAGGVKEYNQDQMAHGKQAISMIQYMGGSRFWFESFQNWQSVFLSVGAMVVLSIFLRQKGSPESKPVDSPHSDTGND